MGVFLKDESILRQSGHGLTTSCLNVSHQLLRQFSFVECRRSFLCDLSVGLSQCGELDGVILFQNVTVAPAKHLTRARQEEISGVREPRVRRVFETNVAPTHQSAVSFLMVSL